MAMRSAAIAVSVGLLSASGAVAADALDKMQTVFEGRPSRATIEREINRVMKAYGLPLTEENYNRAGSVLISMRKETGVPEMLILRCIGAAARSGVPKNMQFHQMAAICSVSLESPR